jgi:universal stress protein A
MSQPNYNIILVAVDLGEESARPEAVQIVASARQLVPRGDMLHLVHVAEHPVTGFGDLTGKNHRVSEIQIRQQLFPQLQTLASAFDVPTSNLHILFGDPADEIHGMAAKLGGDLIVSGSHGKQGLRLLLGSTATRILHGAQCDVLTVRIHPPE